MNTPAFSSSRAAAKDAVAYHIAVVGGGIVGRACALRLAQIGLRVAHVAPPAPASAPAGPDAWDARVYAFSASSQALLEQLRIWPALDMTRVQPVHDMRIFGDDAAARGEHADADLHFSAYAAGAPQLAWIAESSLVERALETALRFAHTVQTFPHAATGFEMDADAVRLTLADGQTIRAECVIGADGKQSWVREQAGIQAEAKPYGQLGVVANFQAEHWHQDTAWQWFLGTPAERAAAAGDAMPARGEILAMLPLPDRRVSMVWSADEAHARELLALPPEALFRAVEAAAGGAVAARFGRLTNITPAQGFPLVLQHASRLVAPRVALVGDAAHVIHPLAGQGMNLGLRDVAEIGRVMAERETMRDHGDLRLLRRYERARREDLLSLTAATDGLHRLFALPGALPRTVRNAGMALVGMTPFIKRLLIKHALG
ncbi:UbiH/UbiF family hydroxylase [Ralstonia mannitolilytica]|uniref:2-octaprenyl-3-methyl-6-methoxy-1,4-benzoquinol hydroxylase n=1 Tax=Ralstonia mannitolilytica TaxID=105219 RepID=A0AAJ4ZQZ1_9RALS|nr:UbiH/UbiF family hydroxylase [Ralstonia mannitolilytica]CAG2149017.1 Ubiquinone hydroxylase UbiL [Ralstonia mannitolilytica]CAJ0728133.1 Ubiquinone hydroxylase UbiL [Ralstonia mannitolilytica]SUD88932.1 2-octaprenyl-3-methyl-6-methoxy-1,4-benzoquinol hydroxylase [Ralstonia mannitolilytica]SUE42338.1 2-octaprenyl-3-methyl-6-methoxy-1,4-benzoquinol hydroxylase [Ralstonia mannitolilytica]